jgi:hypothetical protein
MLSLTDLEEAINYWRLQRPATGEECALSPEVNALAGLYAMMIFEHRSEVAMEVLEPQARQLVQAWRATRA